MEIQILCITKIALMGETYGGDRPQRGFIWGIPPPNAVLSRGY
jgi:hypothetical protein